MSRYGDAGPGPRGGRHDRRIRAGRAIVHAPQRRSDVQVYRGCETQSEVDHYWEKLSAGGQTQQCGWLKDKFGVSWQIVPAALVELICDKDPAISQRVMQAMLHITKIDIAKLREQHAR